MNFSLTHTAKNLELQGPAFTANPAECTATIVTNGSIVPLLTDGLLRHLVDLVAQHGQSLGKHKLITNDGNVMDVAFMANAQHLIVRQDILDNVGKQAPTTSGDVQDTA